MKKRWKDILIVVILVALLSVCIGLIFGTGTYSAAAEETSIEAPQDSADESEAPVFTEKTYRYAHSKTEYVLITLTSDTECTIEMFDGENTGSRKITTTYKQTGGELTVYYMGDVLGRFIINADNTLTEAEETLDSVPENGLIPETEGSKWFSETLMPLILQYGAALLGVLSAGIVLLRKIIKTVKELKEAKTLLKSSDEHNKTSLENMNAFETRMQEQYDEYAKLVQKKLDEMQSGVAADVHETKKAVNKLLAVERRAYLDSPALVSEGTARKIAEVLDETEDEVKSET